MSTLQPTLENELVHLRPLQSEDFPALYEVAKDPKIWELHQNPDRYTLPVFKMFFEEAMASNGAFAILEKKSGLIIGSSRFKLHPIANDAVEIGWTFLGRAYWGGIYNTSFKSLMINHAFQHFDYILFNVDQHNYRSQKAVKKLGGKHIEKDGVLGHLHTEKPTGLTFVIEKTARLK
ncbi:MAG: GNAT family N-acetyltransferase [Bacteroidota bacterium]